MYFQCQLKFNTVIVYSILPSITIWWAAATGKDKGTIQSPVQSAESLWDLQDLRDRRDHG